MSFLDWELLHPRMLPEYLGYLPSWLTSDDSDSASQQIDKHYRHGGGWQPFKGFSMNPKTYTLTYPGDPPMSPLARARLRNETILFYDHSWIGVVQSDGSFEVARID